MNSTDYSNQLRDMLNDATQDADMARDHERVAAVDFENAALAYTKAVMDFLPNAIVEARRTAMNEAAGALTFRINDRTYADTMRDGIATALAQTLALDITDRHGNAVQITFAPLPTSEDQRGVFAYGRFQGLARR